MPDKRHRDTLRESDCSRKRKRVPPRIRNPCRDCPPTLQKHSTQPDEEGNRNRLCAKHSKMVGSYQVRKHAHDREVGFNKDRISLSWFSVVLSRSLFGLLQPILLVLCTTDIRVDSVWIPCGFRVDSVWIPCGFRVDSMCVDSVWIPCGFRVDSTPCGSMWIPCGSVSGRLRSVFVGNTQTILSLGMRRVYRL